MTRKFNAALLLLLCLFTYGFSQNAVQTHTYPRNYFRYPLDLPPVTAGSFGELRPNHFHSGLDFKTNQRTGYPVHAVFDGYVSRLRVQFGGFGNAIYITHPNGYTSVYGHIEKFSDEMIKLIRDTQYTKQSFEVDLRLQPKQIPVCKDEVIALSGNAGASEGPHLHFELRDTQTEETVNPQLFGLTIPDRVPPLITAIGIYHLDGNPFSGKTARQFLKVSGSKGNYHLTKPGIINLSGAIGFGIVTNDMTSVSPNHNGVYSIELKLDGNTVYMFAVERFAFDQTHAINAYIDYPEYLKTHRYIQKCFILPGSKISVYPQSVNRGIVSFYDDNVHKVEYIVKDVTGNVSTLDLKVKSGGNKSILLGKPSGTFFHYDQKNEFSNAGVKVVVMPGNLYDDLDFIYSTLPKKPGMYSAVHRISNKYTPVHDGFELWVKPDTIIPKYRDKAVIVSTTGICDGGVYQDGWVKTQARSFGDFYIKLDTVPPVITPLNIKSGSNLSKVKGIFLRIGDNLSGIKSYNGTIDGKWVLIEWDFKTKILSYTFTGNIVAGKHTLEIIAGDNKNNYSHYTADFYR